MQLYRVERVPMVRLAHLLTGSPVTAEDVVQEAFVRLHPVLDTVADPGAYLRTTVVNLCRSHHRRRGVEERWLACQPSPGVELLPELDETWRALAALSDAQRQALVLRFYLDLRVETIADLLELPVGTVKSTLHRGLAALSKEISS
jgi:RNA polymerase sigma factor (sigma-70 family)